MTTLEHRALASERRRLVLQILERHSGSVELEVLAAETATRYGALADSHTLERIGITLHHVDLPALDDAGLIEYDPAGHLVILE